MKKYLALPLLALFASCYNQENNCKDYKTGTFEFKQEVNGVDHISVFERNDSLQIETFNNKTDTASVRWVSDCEFILQKIHPKTMQEKKAITMKIIMTTEDGYTFEYSFLGDGKKQRGVATRLK